MAKKTRRKRNIQQQLFKTIKTGDSLNEEKNATKTTEKSMRNEERLFNERTLYDVESKAKKTELELKCNVYALFTVKCVVCTFAYML